MQGPCNHWTLVVRIHSAILLDIFGTLPPAIHLSSALISSSFPCVIAESLPPEVRGELGDPLVGMPVHGSKDDMLVRSGCRRCGEVDENSPNSFPVDRCPSVCAALADSPVPMP